MIGRSPSLLILAFLVVVIGSLGAYLASGRWEASVVTGFATLFVLALTYDQEEPARATARADAQVAPADVLTDPQVQRLLDAVPDPMLIVERGRVLLANQPVQALLGREVVGEDIRLAIRHPAAAEHLARPAAAGGPVRIDLLGLGGADQSWQLCVSPLDGRRQVALLLDQSGRQAAEKMRVDFVANASHELRTPLAGILGFIETLADPTAGADAGTRGRFLTIMEGEARRMQRLVDDLMSLSRIEAEKYRAPDQPVDLPSLAEEVAGVIRNDPGGRGADLVLHVPRDLPPVRGDRAQLSQLLHNLIGNACKYGRAGTPVTVTMAAPLAEMVQIRVDDEGEGIAAEHLPRLTERFYRVDSGRSRAMGGTGLGLAIVKHIVERHRGRLSLSSKLGVGTSVTVDLPRFDGDAPAQPIASLSSA
jgi:two-component system phosphate regulon sensor histidine kinase PhoR